MGRHVREDPYTLWGSPLSLARCTGHHGEWCPRCYPEAYAQHAARHRA